MDRQMRVGTTKSVAWGLFLIVLGVAFLLERFGVVDRWVVGQLWPAVFYVIAITHLFEGRPGSFLTFAMMGTWFFACTFGWFDFTYRNSWPFLLVAVGLGLVVKALSGESGRRITSPHIDIDARFGKEKGGQS